MSDPERENRSHGAATARPVHRPLPPAFLNAAHDDNDPSPWVAIYLDNSVPIDDTVKQAWLADSSTRSRQFLLPLVRPLARLTIILLQVVKTVIPNGFTSSSMLHRLLQWGLTNWVAPTGNWLILRHFQLGAEILNFIGCNAPVDDIPAGHDMRLADLSQIHNHAFLYHDLNLFNFVIHLNQRLRDAGAELGSRESIDFSAITDGPLDIAPMPDRWSNFIDLQTAIELFTPVYQLFLTDNDFWRATTSLLLDETIAIYVSRIIGEPLPLIMANNGHPMVPLTTLRAGARLLLHGLNTEMLHAMLVQMKRAQDAGHTGATSVQGN
ncbi:MAG: hypothetical protein ACI8W7_000231 [Gammaproteobacteria bacterium]|jgi:hypothetical protein